MICSLCPPLTITKQIRLKQHRCLVYIKCTDDSYWKNVRESEGEPHYQLGLLDFILLLLCETAFYMSLILCHGPAAGEQCPWCCHRMQRTWPSCSMNLPPHLTCTKPSSPNSPNDAEPGVNQLCGLKRVFWGISVKPIQPAITMFRNLCVPTSFYSHFIQAKAATGTTKDRILCFTVGGISYPKNNSLISEEKKKCPHFISFH